MKLTECELQPPQRVQPVVLLQSFVLIILNGDFFSKVGGVKDWFC